MLKKEITKKKYNTFNRVYFYGLKKLKVNWLINQNFNSLSTGQKYSLHFILK